MPRKKAATDADALRPEGQDAAAPATEPATRTETTPDTPPKQGPSLAAPDAGEPHRSKWAARFDSWGDHAAGVTLIEDRQNRRMTIRFDEKPSEAVRKLVKEEHGYKFDGEDQVWYKRISPAKARQGRDEAEEVAFKAANLIRQEKGLEPKTAFNLGM